MSEIIDEVCNLLQREKVEFTIVEHGAVFTIEEMDKLNLPNASVIAKNLFLRDDKKRSYYLLAVDKNKTVNLKVLREKLESRPLSFASEKDLGLKLGLAKGAVTPLGIINDVEHTVKVFIDESFKEGLIAVHPNENIATVWLKTSELIKVIKEYGNEVDFINI